MGHQARTCVKGDPAFIVSFRARVYLGYENPGRCPGLVYGAPSGLIYSAPSGLVYGAPLGLIYMFAGRTCCGPHSPADSVMDPWQTATQ